MALVLNSVVELALARAWLDRPGIWQMILTALVFLTSLGLGQGFAYLASRMRGATREASPRKLS